MEELQIGDSADTLDDILGQIERFKEELNFKLEKTIDPEAEPGSSLPPRPVASVVAVQLDQDPSIQLPESTEEGQVFEGARKCEWQRPRREVYWGQRPPGKFTQ